MPATQVLFLNREIGILEFNRRVLAQAEDADTPLLERLRAAGITPMVVLHHFSNPPWINAAGGWTNAATVPAFVDYVRKLVAALKEKLQQLKTDNPDLSVVVKGADDVDYQNMINVLDVLQQLDITKVGLATETSPTP